VIPLFKFFISPFIGCIHVHDRNDKNLCLGSLGNLHGADYVVGGLAVRI